MISICLTLNRKKSIEENLIIGYQRNGNQTNKYQTETNQTKRYQTEEI